METANDELMIFDEGRDGIEELLACCSGGSNARA